MLNTCVCGLSKSLLLKFNLNVFIFWCVCVFAQSRTYMYTVLLVVNQGIACIYHCNCM